MEIIWLIAAYLSGFLAQRLRLPPLVGYLVAGLALSLFDVTATPLLIQVGDFGVLLLLFTLGIHLRLESVARPEVLGAGSLHLLTSVLVYTGVAFLFGIPLPTALLLAVALGFSSTVLTVKSLESRQELGAFHGRVAVGILILQDVVAILLLAITGAGTPAWWALGLPALWLLRPFLIKLLQWSGQDELLLVFGLLLAAGVGTLFAAAGLSDKLGALAAGLLLSGHPRADELYERLWGMKEVFLVGFFLQVGLAGFPALNDLVLVAALLLLLPLKGVLFFLLLLVFRLRARSAFMAALTLTAYSEFALIVGTGLAGVGLIEEGLVVVLALVTAVSFAFNAPLSRMANGLWIRYEPLLMRWERPGTHPDHQLDFIGKATHLIVGMGRAGEAAYDFLVEQGERPLGFDVDPAKIQFHLQHGRRVIFGDAQDPDLWEGMNLMSVQAVIMALPNTQGKTRSARLLRALGFDGPINVLLRDAEDQKDLMAAGVNSVSLPFVEAGRELAKLSI